MSRGLDGFEGGFFSRPSVEAAPLHERGCTLSLLSFSSVHALCKLGFTRQSAGYSYMLQRQYWLVPNWLHANPDSKRRFFLRVYIYIYLSTTTTTTICRGKLRKGNKAEGKTYQINSIDPALISCPQPVVTCKSKRKLVRPSSCVTMAEVSEPAARTKGKGKKKRRAIPPKPSSSCRKKWSVAASNVVDIERERKREQLAGLPRAPASFLASRRVCKLPRGRRTMVIPMEDWPCTLCRPLYATRTCW